MNGSSLENELIADGPQVHQAEVSKQTNEEVEEQEMLAMVSEFECTDLLENSVETATARITQCMGEGVGAVMVSQPTAFLTESGFEADQTVAAGLHQVAITHQAHQELSSADQTAVTELTTCFAEDLPQPLPGCRRHLLSLPMAICHILYHCHILCHCHILDQDLALKHML